MFSVSLDLLPRRFHAAVQSAGYRARRWADARQVLANRLAKGRIHGVLEETLRRWGAAEAALERPAEAEFRLAFGLQGEHLWLWDGLARGSLERALLHLPALRAFWRQELRLAHFEGLKAMVPKAWVREETALPPGAVIHGLGIASWDDLPRLQGRQPALVAEDAFVTEQPRCQERINAIYHHDDQQRVVLRSVEALS